MYTGHPFSLTDLDSLLAILKLNIKILKIKNIFKLFVTLDMPAHSKWTELVPYSPFSYSSFERRKYYNKPFECSLQDVIFENITYANFESIFLPDCTLKTIQFINLTEMEFRNKFSISNSSRVEIKSSNFSSITNTFIVTNATEVSKSKILINFDYYK